MNWENIKTLFFTLCFILFICIVIAGIFVLHYLHSAYYDCPNSCFNKDGELWCEMGCWNLMKKYNSTPDLDNVPTECESYPNLKWCK
jgi:hypothetical protein